MKKMLLTLLVFLMMFARCAAAEETVPAETETVSAETEEFDPGCRTEAGLVYYIWDEPERGKVAMVDTFDLEPGQTTLFVPPELGGYPIHYIAGYDLPESIERVFAPESTGGIFPPNGMEVDMILYQDAATAREEHGDELKAHGAVVEDNDLVLTGSYTWYAENYSYTQKHLYLPVDQIPAEAFGFRVNTAYLELGGWLSYPADDCRYYIQIQTGLPVISDTGLPEDARELVVPAELAQYESVLMEEGALGENIRVVYVPEGMNAYVFEGVQGRDRYVISYREGASGELILTGCFRSYVDTMGYQVNESTAFAQSTMPQEVLGRAIDATAIVNTDSEAMPYSQALGSVVDAQTEALFAATFSHGGMLYKVDPYSQTAEIVGYELAEGQTELFVPAQIDGYQFTSVDHDAVPQQIESIWVPENCGMMIWNEGVKPANFERMHYIYEQTAADTITLKVALKDKWDENSLWDQSVQFVYADTLPETVAGNRLQFAPVDSILYRENGWEFWWDGNEARVTFIPDTQESLLVVPYTLGGLPVNGLALELIPPAVQTVCMKGQEGLWLLTTSSPSDRKLRLVYYTDRAGAEKLNPDYGVNPAHLQEDELVWFCALARDYASSLPVDTSDIVIRDIDLPKEISGYRMVFADKPSNILITEGD